jgi:RloB-like protein
MLLRYSSYQKREAEKDAKKLFLLCEGNVREHDYFAMFKGFNSRIHIELIVPEDGDDNSPTGLLNKAQELFAITDAHPTPQFEMRDGDELWFIIDTDQWGKKIAALREACLAATGWYVAQSNPCFEVWLYYHFHAKPSTEVGFEVAENWKQFLNQDVVGGFDSKKHYLLIQTAIAHASHCYADVGGEPLPGSTAVFKPATTIYEIAKAKIDRMLHQVRR